MRPLPSPLTDNAQLDLSLRQLLLQLVVKREALGTVLRSRSEDIGQSSVNTLSSNLSYNFGVYNNQLRNGGSNTSSYLSLNNVTALREHHVVLDGSLYGIGSGQQDSELYKAMYERDFCRSPICRWNARYTELAVLRADDRHFSREDLRRFLGKPRPAPPSSTAASQPRQ